MHREAANTTQVLETQKTRYKPRGCSVPVLQLLNSCWVGRAWSQWGPMSSVPLPEPAPCLGDPLPMNKSIHHKEKYQKGTYCSIGNFYICETNMLLLSSSTDNWDIYSRKKQRTQHIKTLPWDWSVHSVFSIKLICTSVSYKTGSTPKSLFCYTLSTM